jgi:hypothetical protein
VAGIPPFWSSIPKQKAVTAMHMIYFLYKKTKRNPEDEAIRVPAERAGA